MATLAAPHVTAPVIDVLRTRGHSVALNHPYKGVEIVPRHGDPARHRHSLQLEINRRLYMDERTREMLAGSAALQQTLRELVQALLRTDPCR